jgi:hypothetical protein
MSRYLKLLTIGLIAVFALTAAAASAASVVQFHSETKLSYLKAGQKTQNVFELGGAEAGKFKCTNANFSGQTFGKEGQGTFSFSSIALSPEYSGCTEFGTPLYFATNGCQFEVIPTEAVNGYSSRANLAVSCASGKEIVVTGERGVTCANIPPQVVPGVTIVNQPGTYREELLELSVRSLRTTSAKGSRGAFCPPAGEYTNSVMTGTVLVKNYSDAARTKQEGIWIE